MRAQKADGKSAFLTLKINADSGYSSTETHRIDNDQWSVIMLALANAETMKAMLAAPELLALLERLADDYPPSSVGREWIDAALAKARGEA